MKSHYVTITAFDIAKARLEWRSGLSPIVHALNREHGQCRVNILWPEIILRFGNRKLVIRISPEASRFLTAFDRGKPVAAGRLYLGKSDT